MDDGALEYGSHKLCQGTEADSSKKCCRDISIFKGICGGILFYVEVVL